MKLNQWLNRYSIRAKLTAVMLIVSLASVFMMAGVSQYLYGRSARSDFNKFALDAADRLNRQIELYFNNMKLSTSSLLAGPLPFHSEFIHDARGTDLIQKWLRSGDLGHVAITDIEDMLNNYLAINFNEIDGIFLESADHRVVSNVQRYVNAQVYQREPWFNLPLSDHLQILPTHDSAISGNPVISLLIPVYDTESMRLSGRLVIDLQLSEINKIIIRSSLAAKGYFFIVADDGTIVYHPNHAYIGKPIGKTALAALKLNAPTSMQRIRGTEMLVDYSESPLAHWKMVAMVPFRDMASGVNVARNTMLVVLLLVSVGISIFVPMVSQWFTRPLRSLKDRMVQLEQGDFDATLETVPGRDEIQLLNLRFNHMALRLRDLIKTIGDMRVKEMHIRLRQKEASIQKLQNQINPHLLYNTLEIIRSLAYVEENRRIEIIAKNLGDYYRYTASITEREVTLEEELRQSAKYLEIIQIRFPKHFQGHFYVNDKYLDTAIVKCTLQPIIENAVKFAVEPKSGKGSIVVSAFNDGQDLMIEIVDDGPGIAPDKLAEMNERLTYITREAEGDFIQSESLGITNVHARLVLQYGRGYGLTLVSFPERGTVVTVRIPFRRLEAS